MIILGSGTISIYAIPGCSELREIGVHTPMSVLPVGTSLPPIVKGLIAPIAAQV
jgi:hypothetical protein